MGKRLNGVLAGLSSTGGISGGILIRRMVGVRFVFCALSLELERSMSIRGGYFLHLLTTWYLACSVLRMSPFFV